MKSFFAAILAICMLLTCLVSCDNKPTGVERVDFDTLRVDSACTLFKNYDKPACHISISMAVPSPATDNEIRSAVERFISLLPKDGAMDDSQTSSVEAMVDSYVRNYVMDYLSQGPDAIESYGEDMDAAATWMSYEENVEGEVLYNNKGLLSYQVRTYSYTGGAHGSTTTDNGVFDLQTLTPVNLANVFDIEAMPDLNALLRLKLARQYDCETVEELAQKDLFFAPAEVEATDNFMINDSCICWMFDPCDIAPFSLGEVAVPISWDEVYSLLAADSPLMKMAQKTN